jgi:hypothetical protein
LVGLSVLSVIPVLNFLALGYLVAASGRVAATGRFRDGLPGIRKASVIGRVIAGAWLVFLPIRFVSGLWKDAELVAPGGGPSRGWHVALICLVALGSAQVVWACLRGGRPWHFLWPAPVRFLRWLPEPGKFHAIRDGVAGYLASLRLPFYFWLGARAFAGTLLWLLVPVGILMVSLRMAPEKGGALVMLLGAVLLMVVALHLPFLQARFAREDRFGAIFEVKEARRLFGRAPLAFWFALLVTFLLSVPLYLLKVELPPSEIAWLPALLFVVLMLPARLLVGWALGRALRREELRHWFWRWTSRIILVPVVAFYVLVVYLAQYISWDGSISLFQQHAFLLPGLR